MTWNTLANFQVKNFGFFGNILNCALSTDARSSQLSDHVIIYSSAPKNKCYLHVYKVPIFLSVLRLPKELLIYITGTNEYSQK